MLRMIVYIILTFIIYAIFKFIINIIRGSMLSKRYNENSSGNNKQEKFDKTKIVDADFEELK